MEKFIKKTLLHIFLFSLLIALGLSVTSTHYKVQAEALTDLDETTATVKVVLNDEVNYYESFGDAVGNMKRNSIIVLLKDTSISSITNTSCSIDLNGKNLSGNTMMSYCTLIILDSVGFGKLTGIITFYSSNVTIQSGEINNIVLTDRSNGSILGGKITKINANVNNISISGGEIDNLCIYNNAVHLSGGTINKFTFVSMSENFDMLIAGYIYTNKSDNSPIKASDMTSSTQVTILKCTHALFNDSVCDYCGFICEHGGHYDEEGVCQMCGYVCNHQNYFNNSGICEKCNYVCPHLELNEKNTCAKCNLEMEVCLKNSTTKNYLKIEDAVSSIKDGDTLILYKDVGLNNSLSIDAVCTVDLNGCALNNTYVDLNNKISVIDSKGSGFMAVTSISASSQIELRGDNTTTFFVMLNANRLKFYSGQISMINIYDGTIDNVLPSGYIFVKHQNSTVQKLTKQETNVASFYSENCYLTCEECIHDKLDENLNCKYCGKVLSQEEIVSALAKELQETKEELSNAINKKEDVTSINDKIRTLNETIARTQTICEEYSTEKDEELKSQLQDLIATAKQEAITSSNTALELAKNNLLDMVDKKLDKETYNQKVAELTAAIHNAEIASKAYTESKDSELKNELLNAINESKTTLQNVNNEMLERLSKAENNIDNNTKTIHFLKIALIIISISFVLIVTAGFVLSYLYIKKMTSKG